MEERSKKKYIVLKDLEVYQLARELSSVGWDIYDKISEEQLTTFKEVAEKLHLKLNNLITATYKAKQEK